MIPSGGPSASAADSASDSQSTRSCDSCRSRKIKCDRKEPCLQCALRAVVCVYSARKKRKRRMLSPGALSLQYRVPSPKFSSPASAADLLDSPISVVTAPAAEDPILDSDGAAKQSRLSQIEYHLEQLNNLLEQQRQGSPQLPTYSSGASESSLVQLLAKVNAQLSQLGTPPAVSLPLPIDTRQLAPAASDGALGNSDTLRSKWPADAADYAAIGLSDEVADNLAIDSHRAWLPDPQIGLNYLDFFLNHLLETNNVISEPLARSIRTCIYTPEFSTDKYFTPKLACASYMMIQTLRYHTPPLSSHGIDGTPTESTLVRNVFLVLRDPRVLFTPSLLNVQALYTAAVLGQQIYNPGLCWTIISHASRHCLDLGLHLQQFSHPSPPGIPTPFDGLTNIDSGMTYSESITSLSERSRLFWSCFAFDKAMSLTFGRSPSFQTRDCTAQVPPARPWSPSDNFSLSYCKYRQSIEVAFLYDAIYTRLYSAAAEAEFASLGTDSARTRGMVMAALHDEADTLLRNNLAWINTVETNGADGNSSELYNRNLLAMEISYTHRVCLSMIHRVRITDSPESREVYVRTSRDALRLFKDILAVQPSTMHRHMATSATLVFHPFAPFFGVFNAVADDDSANIESNLADLATLQQVCIELKNLSGETSASGVVRRLMALAHEFTEVASDIIERRKWQQVKLAEHVESGGASGPAVVASAAGSGDDGLYAMKSASSSASSLTEADEVQHGTIEDSAPAYISVSGSSASVLAASHDQADTEDCRVSYSEAARQTTLPSWLEFLSDDTWLDPNATGGLGGGGSSNAAGFMMTPTSAAVTQSAVIDLLAMSAVHSQPATQ
ncbi:uncharacterized protein V1518DRAFT_409793 [Limtongia smithiae]|uniref:uncharacterized protein n=1 Tax=Limtongia smithiae TaxID=1125753 RepID=UPI0034CD0C1A